MEVGALQLEAGISSSVLLHLCACGELFVLERSHPAKHFTEIDEECVWSGRTFLSMVILRDWGGAGK